jgi:chromosomal replication initiation ATPase DnaA
MNTSTSNLTVLYGASGSGKTRKLREIEWQGDHDCVLRIGAETLADDVLDSIRSGLGNTTILARYHEVATLLVDNFWVLASRPRMAGYVRDLVASRMSNGLNTILASDMTLAQWSAKQPDMFELLSRGTIVSL